MILYDLTAGMHPRRVRIFMAEKGLSIERREVDAAGGANAMPAFLRLNPWVSCPYSSSMMAAPSPSLSRFVVIWKRCTHSRL